MSGPFTMSVEFEGSTVGRVRATKKGNDIVQCLGVQYATLKDRFAPAVIKSYDTKGDVIDATTFGPIVPASPEGPKTEMGFLQQSLEYDASALRPSDTECLNLNISIPAGALEGDAKLPVFVFIHGGAFLFGSGNNPTYDLARFVRLSVAKNLPVVGVTMNYRLGAPGFLTSEELCKAGYKPNNALRDQRTALLWIQKYIADFGGDPKEVTLVGESAGGVSANYHLHSKEPLFKRVICMSGTVLLEPPSSFESAEAIYEKATDALGLHDATPSQRMEALNQMDIQELRNKLMRAGIPAGPTIDGDIVPSAISYNSIKEGSCTWPAKYWCAGMIMGDCEYDGAIQGGRLLHRGTGLGSAFSKHVKTFFGDQPDTAAALLDDYNISSDMADNTALNNVLEFCTDICWYAPTVEVAESLADDIPMYMYRFNEPNPWPGPNRGRAIHIFDLAALLQNFNDFLDERAKQLNESFAEQVLNFVHGNEPWRIYKMNPVDDGRAANVLGPDGQVNIEADLASIVGRRAHIFPLGRKVGFDRLKKCWDGFA
ncbi:carboxylesterase [Polychaeton citri CBS 116435]|uniref:Carboxylic ester hydrolase n=1 Tax=Polychaeton citri CBS 116435 TaxID=1314669 RepID=A0A9P4QGR1_9PEZI|nr:carboxylesterase [Polychaeton citri CBS 116435]